MALKNKFKCLSVLFFIFYLFAISFADHLTAQKTVNIISDREIKTRLDTIVNQSAENYLKDNYTNGLSIGIYYKGTSHSYNFAKSELASEKSYYNIGSVAKTFVGSVLAQATIDKKMSLHDDIRKYLKGNYPNLQYQNKPITVLHLANHTSALPKVFRQFPPKILDSLRNLGLKDQVGFYALYTKDSLLSDLHKVKLDTIPGTKFSYNSTAMTLLIAVLENVYNNSYENIVTNYLRTHLEITNTKPFLRESEMHLSVQGYNNKGIPQQFVNLRGYYFGPTMNSTIEDMLRYIAANLDPRQKALQMTHQLTFGSKSGFGVGLGWMLNTDNGKRYIYHDGNTKIGFNTLCTLYPDDKLGIIIIANDTVDHKRVEEIENSIKQLILQ